MNRGLLPSPEGLHDELICSRTPCSCATVTQGVSFILSGGADGDIRLWGVAKVSKFATAGNTRDSNKDDDSEVGRFECKRRLTGHHRSATCVSYGRLELVSGHEDGETTAKTSRE